MNLEGVGLLASTLGIPGLYRVEIDPETRVLINNWIARHPCAGTFEVPSGKTIPWPVDRRRWSLHLSTCQVTHVAEVKCLDCESSNPNLFP